MCEDPHEWKSLKQHLVEGLVTYDFTLGSMTTLHDFGGVLRPPTDTFFWALRISWSRLLAPMWSGPYFTRLSLQNDRLKFWTSQNLPIILEKCAGINKRKTAWCQQVTIRLDLETTWISTKLCPINIPLTPPCLRALARTIWRLDWTIILPFTYGNRVLNGPVFLPPPTSQRRLWNTQLP